MVDWTPEILYLSVFEMNARATANPYQVHRHLWRAFPGRRESMRPFLFHVTREGRPIRVVMQSTLPPDPVADRDFRLSHRRAFNLDLPEGAVFAFRITANPTRRESATQRRRSLEEDADRVAWLRRQLEPAAELPRVAVREAWRMHFEKGGRPGVVDAVLMTGTLQVRDTAELVKKIAEGVGPAKAFGCGLLLLHHESSNPPG